MQSVNIISSATVKQAIEVLGTSMSKWPAVMPKIVVTKVLSFGVLTVDLTGALVLENLAHGKTKRLQELKKYVAAKEKKLANQSFVDRAPAEVVQKECDALATYASEQTVLTGALMDLLVTDYQRKQEILDTQDKMLVATKAYLALLDDLIQKCETNYREKLDA